MLTYKNYKNAASTADFTIYNDPFAVIYQQYGNLVRKTISSVIKRSTKDDLDDFVQDFFLDIFRRNILNKYDVSKSSIGTYLKKAALNFSKCKLRFLNAKKRSKDITVHCDDFSAIMAPTDHHAELELSKDKIKILDKTNKNLSSVERNIMGFSMDGLLPNEISNKINLPLKEVYKVRSNAFKKAKSIMSNLGY